MGIVKRVDLDNWVLVHKATSADGTQHLTVCDPWTGAPAAPCADYGFAAVQVHVSVATERARVFGESYRVAFAYPSLPDSGQGARLYEDPDVNAKLAAWRGQSPAEIAKAEGNKFATFLGAEQQAEVFAGCVYVLDSHRVLSPGGRLLRPEQFKALFGGMTFMMDARNERTTRDAFEALTQSQLLRRPAAVGTCFRPDLPPASLVGPKGSQLVNTWWPAEVRRVLADASPFYEHLAKLLPVASDQEILLYWMANVVQHPGHKFGWAPVLQGVSGNGKSFIVRCLEEAVGSRYVWRPRPDSLDSSFNAWMDNRLLMIVEEPKLNRDTLERLKARITDTRLELEGKGVDQRIARVCANWIFVTNHQDGVPKTQDDRRYSNLWCAQQTTGDLVRDGLDKPYFKELYDWADYEDGYATVADQLARMRIPEGFGLDWAKGRAPETSSTDAAIEASRSPAELAVLEAIERNEIGFRGGWASSLMLARVLEVKRLDRECPPAARAGMLEALGFVTHPALASSKGQTHNPVMPDNGKPKLFVRKDSPAFTITRGSDAARAYQAAQGVA